MSEERKVGALRVSKGLLEQLLGIPPGHSIIGAHWSPIGEEVCLWIEGADMPAAQFPQPVDVHFFQTVGKIEAAWSHLPDQKWIVRAR